MMANEENASTLPEAEEQATVVESQKNQEVLEIQEDLENQEDLGPENTEAEQTDALNSVNIELSADDVAKQLAQSNADLQAFKKQAAENWEQLLRARADLENFRRRAEKDLESVRKYALEKFAGELLSVKDTIEMGLSAQPEDQDVQKIKEGMELTLKMFSALLTKFSIEEIDPQGEPFDPQFHEAMSMAESDEHTPNTVTMVFQKGYCLNDRLLRPAKVIVAKAVADQQQALDVDDEA